MTRLREGQLAYQQGDFAGAARALRLACFGLLDEPELLAEGLVRLTLVQHAMSDVDGTLRTFTRLVEIEERFDAYRQAELEPKLREDLEALLLGLPPEAIAWSPTFQRIVDKRREAAEVERIAGLSDRERAQRLERQLAQEPDDRDSIAKLADLRLRSGRHREAADLAARALGLGPADPALDCLRAAALANDRANCEQALSTLSACPDLASDPDYARGGLSCQVELKRWADADQLAASLGDAARRDLQVVKLLRTVDRQVARLERRQTRAAESVASAPEQVVPEQVRPGEAKDSAPAGELETGTTADALPAVGRDVGPVTPRPPSLPPKATEPAPFVALLQRLAPADAQAARNARKLLEDSVDLGQVESALILATEVADRNPDRPEAQFLAAEIAYRASRWPTALTYFRRGGDPGDGRPDLLFYLAVSSYEAGYREAAEGFLARCLPKLPRNPLVTSYAGRILGAR